MILLVAFANLCQINMSMIFLVVVISVIGVLFFMYSRPVITKCKELELQTKSFIFQFCNESISGSAQIKTYSQKNNRLDKFSDIVNCSTKAAINYDLVSKALGYD